MNAPRTYTAEDVLSFLKEHENAGGKKVLLRHGAREPFFGTRIGDMKKLTRKIKKDHDLSLELWKTGNSDAMYFAALIADESRISAETLRKWVSEAYWYLLSESAVASVAAETPHGFELAREWIESPQEMTATAGWSTWCSLLSNRENGEFDTAELETLLDRVESQIHSERNRVRYAMNSFVINLGCYHPAFTKRAKEVGKRIGTVSVDTGDTACTVPTIAPYIEKVEKRGAIGKKRPDARC